MNTFRWVINAVVVGAPFSVFLICADLFNIVINAWWNKWWAGGNFFLIWQSCYMIFTSIFAIFLVFEINVILKWAKIWRVNVLLSAIAYNFIYFIVLAEWLVHLL